MITKTNTGVEIEGRLVYDPQIKQAGAKDVYKMVVRAYSKRREDGQYDNLDIECCFWHDIDKLDGMFFKGDRVLITAREIKTYTGSNGKTYKSVDVDGFYPDFFSAFRREQEIINIACEGTPPVQPEQWPQADEASLNVPQPAAQEELQPTPTYTEDEARIIETDEEDLPF